MSSANHALRPRFLLRNVADIKRLFIHLLTHWRQPRVEFRIDGLHVVHSQRAQDRFVRLSEACNCVLGEILGGVTLLLGCYAAWVSMHGWRTLGLAVFTALGVACLGKGIEFSWTRMKLLLVLRGLRRRLGTAEGSPERDHVLTTVAPAGMPLRSALMIEDDDAAQDSRIQRPLHRKRSKQPKVQLRDAADIDRVVRHVATHWKLPRIVINVDALPTLDVQRAQHRIVRFSSGCSYLPAALLAVAILLFGLLYAIWTKSQEWMYSEREDWWLLKLDWGAVQPVVIAVVGAALVGILLEMLWLRVRLLLVLRRLRNQLG